MKIAVGCDHAGFGLKSTIVAAVQAAGHEVLDMGTDSASSVDYPDFAAKVGAEINAGRAERGILLCGSGVGICIAANKIKGVYAATCHDTYSAHQGVEHDAMNVLCLGAKVVGTEPVKEIVNAFLSARFIGNDPGEDRHNRRVGKVRSIEKGMEK